MATITEKKKAKATKAVALAKSRARSKEILAKRATAKEPKKTAAEEVKARRMKAFGGTSMESMTKNRAVKGVSGGNRAFLNKVHKATTTKTKKAKGFSVVKGTNDFGFQKGQGIAAARPSSDAYKD